jgi:serine/threonine-protein kinase
VFRGHDVEHDRVVAIKLFKLDVRPERVHQLRSHFDRLVTAELTHPAIAAPIATGIVDVSAYLASEYITGESFDLAIREYGPAPAPDALRVAAQLAGALDFAAVINVHHGALHPRDVLLSPGETRVTGIGVARALEQIGLATPLRRPYSAPERMAGAAWDRRADVFALAALIHELLWGRRITGVGTQVADGLTEIPQGDLAALRSVFARALAENPGARYETALEFAEALKNAFPDVALTPPVRPEIDATKAAAAAGVAAGALGVSPGKEQPVSDDLLPLSDPEPMPPLPIHAEGDTLTIAGEDDDLAAGVAPPFAPASIDATPDLDLRAAEESRYADVEIAPAVVPDDEPRTISTPASPARETRHDILGSDARVERRDAPVPETSWSDVDASASPPRSRSGALVAVALLFGLGLGFAAAFMLLSRGSPDVPTQASATDTQAASPSTSSTSSTSSTGPRSSPTSPARAPAGREFTEGAVAPPARPQPAPSRSNEATAPRSSGSAAAAVPPKTEPNVGRLLVRSTPAGALVFVDGRDAGRTPTAVRDLSPGTHRVRIVRDGYVPVERRIVISASRPAQSLIVPLDAERTATRGTQTPGAKGTQTRAPAVPAGSPERYTGTVNIESRPSGAKVYLDNKLVGTTPLSMSDVRAGEHVVRLEHDGYRRWTSMVRVVAAERNRVTASLEK